MTKKNVNGNLVFTATVPTYLPPIISHDFIDDEGNLQYALANGNTIPAVRYNSMWNAPKGIIDMHTKGKGLDGRTNWIK